MCYEFLFSGFPKIITRNHFSRFSTKARNKAKGKTTRINMEYGQDVEISGIPL
jgi:hypothetical protein